MRAAAYARLSRPKDKAELGANIRDQESTGEELIRRKGWDHIGTFTDDGRGAYQDEAKRPAWEAMLAAKPDRIVVRDIERLGRHPREYVALLDSKAKVVEWLDEETADVRWDAEPVDPDTDEFQQKTVGARSYSRKIGAKVKRKIRTKANDGAWPHGGTRAYGYHDHCCRDDAGHVTCEQGSIRNEEAAVIQEVAERWLAGETLMSLCRDLTERGLMTPTGKPWQYARLRQMLSGPRIAGIRTYKGVETKGNWTAIVSPSLHRKLATAASGSIVKRTAANGSYTLSGLLRCECGCHIYGHRQHARGKVLPRYACVGTGGCGLSIAALALDEYVGNRSFLAILAPELRESEQLRREVDDLAERRLDLETRVSELDAAYWTDRTIDKERWLTISTELTASIGEVTRQQANLRRQLTRERDLPTTAEELAMRWQCADTKERNRLLRSAVDRVEIVRAFKSGRFDPRRVSIHFRNGHVDRLDDETRSAVEIG